MSAPPRSNDLSYYHVVVVPCKVDPDGSIRLRIEVRDNDAFFHAKTLVENITLEKWKASKDRLVSELHTPLERVESSLDMFERCEEFYLGKEPAFAGFYETFKKAILEKVTAIFEGLPNR
jgi:hypothetical protein